MKPTILGLMIAAAAFGASTIYLAVQLDEERTRATQVLAESRALQARIAELEILRAQMAAAPDSAADVAALPAAPPLPEPSARESAP